MRELCLLTINGDDHPGVTAAFTATLSQHGVNVLDIGQAVIHYRLNLGLLVEIPDGSKSGVVMKELLFLARAHKLEINFAPIADHDYEKRVGSQGRACVEFSIRGEAEDLEQLRHDLLAIARDDAVDVAFQAELLRNMAGDLGIDMRQTIAVGDGANDLPMLSIAGPGVALHAKPPVKKNARHAISTPGLDGILYLLGVRDHEANE